MRLPDLLKRIEMVEHAEDLPGKSKTGPEIDVKGNELLSQRLILIVDDESMNRTVLGAMLRQLGFHSHIAQNGREAVEATRHESYAAILMDCLMPEMDGYEATRAIRRDEIADDESGTTKRRVPVIAVTAVAIQGARERCIEAGMDDYLSKPVVLENLADVLDRWINREHGDGSWSPDGAVGAATDVEVLVDSRAIQALRDLGAEDADVFVADIVHEFVRDVSSRLDAMRAAITRGDSDGLVQGFHSVAGCAAMVGAVQVERVARSLPAGDPLVEGGEIVDELETAFKRTCLVLDTAVGSGSTSDLPPA